MLMDGNFLHAVSQMKLNNLEEQISNLLGSKVRLFVPSCVMRELRDMAKNDKAYQGAVALARKFLRHKDACPPTLSTCDAIIQQIGSGNEQHWWLATQDRSLWATLQQDVANPVPLLYASTTGLHLLPVSDALQKGVSDKAAASMKVGQEEKHFLQRESDEAPIPSRMRKKPSAPNPLAVKQKVEKQQQAQGGANRRKRQRSGPKES